METIKSLFENFKTTDIYSNLEANFTSEQIALILCGIVAIAFILVLVLSIIIISKFYKTAKKKEWLIEFGIKDILSALGILLLVLIVIIVIGDGFSPDLIFPIILLGILGILGIKHQIDKKEIYQNAGYTGIKLYSRIILNLVCGFLSIPLMYVILPMWVLKMSPKIFSAIIESSDDSDGKKRVEYTHYKNEKGELETITTQHITDNLSVSYFKDENGKEHTVQTNKR